MDYVHIVQYYETDRMGITHHSNYIRWMEEARVDFLSQIGWDYAKLEAAGIVSPVLSVNCEYKRSTTFSDKISVGVSVKEFKGVRLFLYYEMKNEAGETVCLGTTSHTFLNTEGKPVILKREHPEFYGVLCSLAPADE